MKSIRKQSVLVLFLGIFSLFCFLGNTVYAEENKGFALAEQLQNFFVELSEKVRHSVVVIEPLKDFSQPQQKKDPPNQNPPDTPDKPEPKEEGTGSGVIITADGYIISNYHVVGEADRMKVIMADKKEFIATIVGRDPDTDLSLLKINSLIQLPFSTLGNSDNVKTGQWVIAVGEPFGFKGTTTFGIVSGLNRDSVGINRFEDFIQTDASINPGNSGGPLFNIQGEVVGINTAIINGANTIGFAIPANLVKEITDQLKVSGRVSRGWLGIGIQELSQELAEKFNWDSIKGGVLISETFVGQPADQAGLKHGDIILKVDGVVIETQKQLSKIIAGFKPGTTIEIEIAREGDIKNFSVILNDREKSMD
ncbi:MAG: trypsin-like peptidase domain-containing protein [Candidatus Brennerbacteria bacterium]|nr:trypsin-like peptidase domain-containing protein [Candidatus Brennerbacteria bacterium]